MNPLPGLTHILIPWYHDTKNEYVPLEEEEDEGDPAEQNFEETVDNSKDEVNDDDNS